MKPTHLLLAAGLLLSSSAWAQDDGKGKDKDKKEYKDDDRKDYDKDRRKDYEKDRKDYDKDRNKDYDKDRKDYDKDRNKDRKDYDKDRDERSREGKDGRYDSRDRRPAGGLGGVLGRVILPRTGTAGPRELAGVPRGHYPPPGECRIWYPNRPAGHQPPPTSCERLANVRLEPGAFILHGDRAYDAEYDWRAEEKRRPGTVGRDILDVLFPRR